MKTVIKGIRVPTVPLTEIEQSAFCRTDETLEAKTLEQELDAEVQWQKIPFKYLKTSPEKLDLQINEARTILNDQLLILGHHYQRNQDTLKACLEIQNRYSSAAGSEGSLYSKRVAPIAREPEYLGR